jgi:hypothetical protein
MTAGLKRVPKIIYIGVFLNKAQREKLLAAVPAKHSKVHADHVTLVFQPSPQELAKFDLGSTVELEVTGEAFDEKGQAVLVAFKDGGIGSKNVHPHITISTAEGTKPVYSNELFEKCPHKALTPSVELVGMIDTYPRTTQGETNG